MTERDVPPAAAPDDRRGHRGLRFGLYGGAALVLLAAGYLGLAAVNADRIPSGTTVGGVDVGGMSRHDAAVKLDTFVRASGARPVTIVAEGRSLSLVPAKSGMRLDDARALDNLTGFTLAPGAIWHRLTGGGEHRSLRPVVDKQALRSAIATVGETLHGAPQIGTIEYVDGAPTITKESVAGSGLQPAELTDQIAAGWPGKLTYTAKLTHQSPAISNADLRTFADGTALTAVSAPVVVTNGIRSASISTTEIASALEVVDQNGSLALKVKSAQLNSILTELAPRLNTLPHNGKVIVSGSGSPTYVAPTGSTAIDPSKSDADFLAAVLANPNASADGKDSTSSTRTFVAKTMTVPPSMSLDQLKSLRLDKVSEFETFLPGGPDNEARTKNIKIALSTINGMVVGRGEQFSLLEELGPLEKSRGYVDAPSIIGGIEKPALAGGLSQVSTTLFNAAFFAGAQLDEHTPHAFWISRYPVGREATLWTGYIDNKWTNNTNGPIVIQAGVVHDSASGTNQVRIAFLGVPTYTVTTTTGPRTHIVQPKTRHLSGPSCVPMEPVEGFDIVVTRQVSRGGQVVDNNTFKTHYIPADKVTCN